MNYRNNRGFTLIEMSIVLLIVGFLVGGIIAGRELLQNSRVTSTLSQLSGYATAHNAFELKYDGIPGDFKGVEDYGLHYNKEGLRTACRTYHPTDNISYGNGNGRLESQYPSPVRANGEILNYFIMLSNAQLTKDRLGLEDTSNLPCNYTHYEGVSYPKVEVSGGLIALSDESDPKDNIYYILGGMGTSHHQNINHATEENAQNIAGNYLTPEIALQIETKIDETIDPLEGSVRVITAYQNTSDFIGTLTIDATDADDNCVYNGGYNIALDEPACTLAVKMNRQGRI